MIQYNNYRQLLSNKHSRVLVVIGSHGGENFIKVRRNQVILSYEMQRTLNEMYIKERYKELYIILDTCEGYTLYDEVNVPNIFFFSSASLNQKSSSYMFDDELMESTVDRFHYLLYTSLNELYINQSNLNMSINMLLDGIIVKKEFLGTDAKYDDKIKLYTPIYKIFGNPFKLHHKNVDLYNICYNDTVDIDFNAFDNYLSLYIKDLHNYSHNTKAFSFHMFSLSHYDNLSDGNNFLIIYGLICFAIFGFILNLISL